MQPNDSEDDTFPSWRQRPRPIGIEYTYRLAGNALEIVTPRRTERIPLATIRQLRFSYAPSNVSTKGFRTQLRLNDGRMIGFGNLSWRSLMDVERNDVAYHAFVEALAGAIVEANPSARFRAGKPHLLWLIMTGVGAVMLATLCLFSLRAFQHGTSNIALFGVLLIAALLWQVVPMIRLNRPRDLAPGEVPDDLVPGRAG